MTLSYGERLDEVTNHDNDFGGVVSSGFEGLIGLFKVRMVTDVYLDYFEFMHKNHLTITRTAPHPKTGKLANFSYDDINRLQEKHTDKATVFGKDGFHDSSDLSCFAQVAERCADIYTQQFPAMLMEGTLRQTPATVERSLPSEGHRRLHADINDNMDYTRAITAMAFLNDDFECGELEFWHQSIRIEPEKCLLVIFPSDWTHAYRCLPPKSGARFTITSFFERSLV